MAKIINNKTEESKEIEDRNSIIEACVELGVPFSCEDGYCGLCKIEVLEGQENLSELTESEQDLGMDKSQRLACQCKIKSGVVKIDF